MNQEPAASTDLVAQAVARRRCEKTGTGTSPDVVLSADVQGGLEPVPVFPQRRRVRQPVTRAEGGDHATIYYFLQSVFQAPSRTEYNASLEDPFYEPRDRMLLRRQRRIVAHAHLTHRTMALGSLAIPAAGLQWLGVAPEQQGRGLGLHLLRAAEDQMHVDGALVGMLRTSRPHFFRQSGWALCGQPSYRRADARAIVARLLDRRMIPRRRRRLHIRPWLQWELAALTRIYNQNLVTLCGPLERTDAYWRWLIGRRGCETLYVALEGPDQLELGEVSTRIVGYAAVRGNQIVELMASPDCPRASAELLYRCCGDAIERDCHSLVLHAPPGCPLFEFFDEAGGSGSSHASDRGEVQMMRLVSPLEFLQRLGSEFAGRAAAVDLPRPLELGLLVDGQKYQIELGAERVGATSERMGRSYLRLNIADFTRLVLGQLDWDLAVSDGRLECSTALAGVAGRALFPSLPHWRPPWDDLPAIG